eukprot:snap_masked-scaffold_8-processed-gene-0.14-mRNA-1 protein AED:0.90 eAED:0.91 QI:0/0/0/0.4/1/1/5/0/371
MNTESSFLPQYKQRKTAKTNITLLCGFALVCAVFVSSSTVFCLKFAEGQSNNFLSKFDDSSSSLTNEWEIVKEQGNAHHYSSLNSDEERHVDLSAGATLVLDLKETKITRYTFKAVIKLAHGLDSSEAQIISFKGFRLSVREKQLKMRNEKYPRKQFFGKEKIYNFDESMGLAISVLVDEVQQDIAKVFLNGVEQHFFYLEKNPESSIKLENKLIVGPFPVDVRFSNFKFYHGYFENLARHYVSTFSFAEAFEPFNVIGHDATNPVPVVRPTTILDSSNANGVLVSSSKREFLNSQETREIIVQDDEDFARHFILSPESFAEGELPNISNAARKYGDQYFKGTKEKIKNMMLHAYRNYEAKAFGQDELQPV